MCEPRFSAPIAVAAAALPPLNELRRRRGLSLVEVVVATTLVGVLLVAATKTLGQVVRGRTAASDTTRGLLLAQELMAEVVDQISPTMVIPMHYFSAHTLARFIALIEDSYQPLYSDTATVTLSSLKLPYHKILVLPGS